MYEFYVLFQSRDDQKYVYIFRDDLYWACVMGKGSLTEQCGPMLITESLCQLHRVCSTLCGTITQHSITSNLTLISEVVQETMVRLCSLIWLIITYCCTKYLFLESLIFFFHVFSFIHFLFLKLNLVYKLYYSKPLS